MRALFSVVLCLLVVFVRAEDYVLGEREQGDYLITDRNVHKHASHHCHHSSSNTTKAITVKAPDPNDVIDWVKIKCKHNVSYELIKGGIDKNSLTVLVTRKGCHGLHLHVKAYAISSNGSNSSKITKSSSSEIEGSGSKSMYDSNDSSDGSSDDDSSNGSE